MRTKISKIQINNDTDYWKRLLYQCDIKILPFADTTKWQLFRDEPDIAISNLMISIIFNGKMKKNSISPVCFTGLKAKGIDTFDTRGITILLDRYPRIINGKITFYANYKLKGNK